MESPVFLNFPELSKNDWQATLEKDLRGRAIEDVLFRVNEAMAVEPYYVKSDLDQDSESKSIQSCQRHTPGWLTLPMLEFRDPAHANQHIRRHLCQGAEGVWLHGGDTSLNHLELLKTLHTIRLTDTPIFLDSPESAPGIIRQLTQGASYYLKGGIVHDPMAHWMRTGQDFSTTFDGIAEGMALTKAMREFRSYKVESHVFHEAGADVVQELAYTLAAFVTCLDELTERGITPLLAANRFVFSISIGTDYLTEIAKLRALRYLYRKITRAYGLPDELCQAFIQGQSSLLYQSVHSPHTNIVRHTAEAMSAVMGGCDALSILPYDAGYSETGHEFSERVARNISLVLKNESYLDKVADPAAGSYFLEILTQEMADSSWKLFLEIEQKGGLPKAFGQNFIQRAIEHSWIQKIAEFQNDRVMVGVNKFQEKAEGVPLPSKNLSEKLTPNWEYSLLEAKTLDDVAGTYEP